MCGIAGKLFFDTARIVDEQLIKNMCSAIIHRGPNDEGIYCHANFGFGMRRLSIIDLKTGNQPIFNENRSIGIIFNGEIYNYKEIRNELLKSGYTFHTNSDTETILYAFEEYGIECLHKLNGMFSIAIWDAENKKLFLARDRLGIKPLYYYLDQEKLVFGSEIKPILEDKTIARKVDYKALSLYLTYNYVPAPYSMFEGIKKLPAGHHLEYKDKKVTVTKYWDVDYSQGLQRKESDLVEEFKELLNDAVKIRMLSEVPIGAFLSGGVDSSSIVALMSRNSSGPVKTFSIGFKNESRYDETNYARLVAKKYNTDHTAFMVESNMIDIMPTYIHHFDEPFGDYAAFPTYILSKLAKEHVTVVLTGDGGDEIFAGYNRYANEIIADYYCFIPPFIRKNIISKLVGFSTGFFNPDSSAYELLSGVKRKSDLSLSPVEFRYIEGLHIFLHEEKKCILKKDFLLNNNFVINEFSKYYEKRNFPDSLSRQLYLDTKTILPENMLTKIDRTSMAVSLEARVPLLDYRIVEFAAGIPSPVKMNFFNLKRFLKKSVKDILPPEIIHRPKHGFSSPIDKWLRTDLKELLQDTLSEKIINETNIFSYKEIKKMIDSHMAGTNNHGHKLFLLMVFHCWHVKYI